MAGAGLYRLPRPLRHLPPSDLPTCPAPPRCLCSDGEVWRRQRRLSNPAFRRAAVEQYAEVRGCCTGVLVSPMAGWAS